MKDHIKTHSAAPHWGRPTRTIKRALGSVTLILTLAGCMQSPGVLDRFNDGEGLNLLGNDGEVARRSSSFETVKGEDRSEIIETLLARTSILEPGSPYARVGQAALDASARASEAELRAARLRAQAKSKNWLPTIGPNISLTSLGDVVTSLLVEQVLFDNGRRKAERAFAAADVEVAAVTLSSDMNDRVETAVALYVAALRGDEKAELNRRALSQMYEFERIVRGRVNGGISDRSDLRVVESKINDIVSAMASAEEAAKSARAELLAMTGNQFDLGYAPMRLDRPSTSIRPLSVLLAEAEGKRGIEEAKIERAGLLPSVTASANVSGSGTDGAIGIGGAQLGFGTPSALKAIEAAQDASSRTITQAEEDARRRYTRQEQRLASYKRQETEANSLADESRETFGLFQRQFKAGTRSVMDVASIYEEMVQRQQTAVDAKYEVILIHLEMAGDQGLLADGGSI